MKLLAFVLLISSALPSCSSVSIRDRENLDIGIVGKFKLLKTTREQVVAILNKPDKIFQVDNSSEEIWLYFGKYGATRLSLGFDAKSGVLDVIGWFVKDNDAEMDVKAALARFPSASFVLTEAEWVNPHAAPSEAFYTDAKLGVKVEINKYRKTVQSISWIVPGLVPSESKRTPAAKYEL